MNGIHHGNTNRPTRFSCCCEESHESKRVSCSMGWDSLESIFVPQRCVLFISFVVPISVFCIPYLSESFFFRSSSFEFLLWVIFNYLYVIVWFETRTICVWKTMSLPAGCVNLVPYDSCSDVLHFPKWKCVTSHTNLLSTMQMRVSHTHLEVSMVKNIWCHICLNHRAIEMCMTSRAFALWLALRARTKKQPLLSWCILRINDWTIWQVQFLFVQYQT